MKIDKLETWSLKPNQVVASVGRKVLSSYGWCSHFVGEPVAYAIFKERRSRSPFWRVETGQLETSDRLPSSTPALGTPNRDIRQTLILLTHQVSVKKFF